MANSRCAGLLTRQEAERAVDLLLDRFVVVAQIRAHLPVVEDRHPRAVPAALPAPSLYERAVRAAERRRFIRLGALNA